MMNEIIENINGSIAIEDRESTDSKSPDADNNDNNRVLFVRERVDKIATEVEDRKSVSPSNEIGKELMLTSPKSAYV